MENLIKMDDLGVPIFLEKPRWNYLCLEAVLCWKFPYLETHLLEKHACHRVSPQNLNRSKACERGNCPSFRISHDSLKMREKYRQTWGEVAPTSIQQSFFLWYGKKSKVEGNPSLVASIICHNLDVIQVCPRSNTCFVGCHLI